MSDFLIGFINQDQARQVSGEAPSRNGRSHGYNKHDRAKSSASECAGVFYKNDDTIHVKFEYRGKTEEIIIPPLPKNDSIFCGKNVIFYGPSRSGKTFSVY